MIATYYRDRSIVVTSHAIEVDGAQYPLLSLDQVWHRRTGRVARGAYMLLTRGALVVAMVGGLIAVALLVRRIDFGGRTTLVLAGIVLGVIVLGAAAAFGVEGLLDLVDRTHDHGKGVHEIWILLEDEEIMILSTSDASRFGRVYRALQRAMEQNG